MVENWKLIEGFPAYEISDLGQGRRVAPEHGATVGKFLKPRLNTKGYWIVALWQNNIGSSQRVHRLVAKAFLPNPLGLPEVNHIGEKTDNRATKLEWRSIAGHELDRMLREQKGTGVYFSRTKNRWIAKYTFRGHSTQVGSFGTYEEALAARRAAVREIPWVL